jgi:serine/threonine protein kinase
MLSKLASLFGPKKKGALPRIDLKKRFDLIGKTGQGSMSKVYRARDNKLGRVVCLKVLDKLKTAKFEARFVGLKRPMEGAILMALRHENVVQTFEHGLTKEGEQWIVMELIDGVGLNFLIETHSPSLETHRIDYLIQAAEGLDYIHQQGYLHRDICPRNIMVNKEGVVKYIDFGLAVPFQKEFCKPGNRTGTPNYMAPELIKRMTTDQRVDLFALGVTAYEMFTGNLPWERAQSLETVMSHLNSPAHDPRKYKPDMDEATARLLIKAVERDPKKRFQNAKDFRHALEALQE